MSKTTSKKRDSAATRERIVRRSATLLKTSGYLRAPLSAIMKATGLEKGGIYHHFESREALALEAFKYSTESLASDILATIAGLPSAKEKLLVLIRFPFHEDYWRGGCPIANLAIESDDANRRLRAAARRAMDWLLALFERVIEEGMSSGEFRKGDPKALAAGIVAELEGGIVLSNLYKDLEYLERIVQRLETRVNAGFKETYPK